MSASDDAAVVRSVLDAHEGSPAAEAFDRLVAYALRYEWVLPIVGGEETPEATARTLKIADALMLGHLGDAAVAAAMRA